MLENLLPTYRMLHICIGAIFVLSTTWVYSDNTRYNTGIWSIDPHHFLAYNQKRINYPTTFRKLYWYAARNPALSARQQHVGNIQMQHGYRGLTRENRAHFGNQLRASFPHVYDGSLAESNLFKFVTPATLPPTSVLRATEIKQLENTIQPFHKKLKICKENKNNTIVPVEIENTSGPQHFPTVKSISNNMPENRLLFEPFVAHTYFTLDDVILPYSSEKPKHKSNQENTFLNESQLQLQNHFTPQDIRISNKATVKILDSDLYTATSIKSEETTMQTATTELPHSTTLPNYKTEIEISKEPLSILTTTNPTVAIEIPNEIEIPNVLPIKKDNWTLETSSSLRKNLTLDTFKIETCNACEKNRINSDSKILKNNTHSHEPYIRHYSKRNSSTILIQNHGLEKRIKKKVTVRNKFTQTHNKYGLSTLSGNQHVPKFTNTTESTPFKSTRNLTNPFFPRGRKLTVNATVLSAIDFNQTIKMNSKIPNVKYDFKKPKFNNFTESLRSRDAKKSNARESSPLPTTKVLSENTILATDSAIMTISNTNGNNLKTLKPTIQKHFKADNILNRKDIGSTVDVPQLPIEVYFTKLTHN